MEEFNEAKFKTKVNNIFVKLFTGVMKGNLEEVKLFLSADVLEKYQNVIDEHNSSNERQMYDELNVKDTFISNLSLSGDIINEEKTYVIAELEFGAKHSKDYILNKIL